MCKRKFGGCRCVGVGGVQNDDPALRSGGHVYVVNPDAGAADDLQHLSSGDHGCSDMRLGPHDDAIVGPDAPNQLSLIE